MRAAADERSVACHFAPLGQTLPHARCQIRRASRSTSLTRRVGRLRSEGVLSHEAEDRRIVALRGHPARIETLDPPLDANAMAEHEPRGAGEAGT